MMRHFGAVLCTFGVLLWLTACLLMPVLAAEKEMSLTLICQTEDVTLSGMQWRLYRVGERISGSNSFKLQGDFAEYDVSMEELTSSALQDAADTLENYAVLDQLKPEQSGEADDEGKIAFPKLSSGLYLLSGKSMMIGNKRYIPSAILVELSNTSEKVDFISYPKFKVREMPTSGSEMYVVKKVWVHDEEYLDDRSTELTVAIYQDEMFVEEVKLNEENNWTYRWSGNTLAEWRVKEVKVPENYTVIYRSNETQYVILNAHGTVRSSTVVSSGVTTIPETTAETVPTDITEQSEIQTQSGTNSETVFNGSGNTGGGSSSGKNIGKLPQTGLLWWPVPVLVTVGLVCIMIGWRMRRKK